MFEVIPDNQDDISSFATQSIHDYEEWEKERAVKQHFEILNDFE